ncbi:GntR family transcriptional regulator [Atopobacter phocae]|uniref:GntR family transcriptional regulator n=1 Tax=Atopobacter phocae TaxID=136492 RepID=UPI0004702853|nr:UTRA domain-containing protein [Atopobacter phocae]
MSKYKKVYETIKQQIDQGQLLANQELPSENDLMQSFGYSKDTIRRALALLETDGYIHKTQGRNSIVMEHGRMKNNFLSELRTSDELNRMGSYQIHTELVDFYIVQSDPTLMQLFEVDEHADFYRVARTRKIDGQRIEYEVSYFDRQIIPHLSKDIASQSIYAYLENDLGLKINHSRREISFRFATDEEKIYMDLGPYNMVTVVTSLTYLSNGQLFQQGTICYRPDKFTFVTMAKR